MPKPQHYFLLAGYKSYWIKIAVRRLGNIGNKFILLKHKYIDTAKSTVSAYQYVKKKWFLYESLNKIRLVTTGQWCLN